MIAPVRLGTDPRSVYSSELTTLWEPQSAEPFRRTVFTLRPFPCERAPPRARALSLARNPMPINLSGSLGALLTYLAPRPWIMRGYRLHSKCSKFRVSPQFSCLAFEANACVPCARRTTLAWMRGCWLARLPRARGNPRARGSLTGSSRQKRRCAEGGRDAVSRRRPALLAAPWRWR